MEMEVGIVQMKPFIAQLQPVTVQAEAAIVQTGPVIVKAMRVKVETGATVSSWRLLFGPRILEEVKPAIFSSAEEIGDAIAVPIYGGRAHIVSFDVSLTEPALIAHDPRTVTGVDLAEQVGVRRVDQQIEFAV